MCLLSMSFEFFRVSVCNLLLEQMFVQVSGGDKHDFVNILFTICVRIHVFFVILLLIFSGM